MTDTPKPTSADFGSQLRALAKEFGLTPAQLGQEIMRESLPLRRFEHVLRKHSVVDTAAFDDPENYDNHETLSAVRAAHRELLKPE